MEAVAGESGMEQALNGFADAVHVLIGHGRQQGQDLGTDTFGDRKVPRTIAQVT